jgi:nitrite reductase/ring-hydroxylating ferredoxin subunit
MSNWIPVFEVEELTPGSGRLFRNDTHRIAIFRLEDGDVFAVDNACPHEGYPLVQGEVKEKVLTCAWHNFKFRLTDGACIKGDEDVRAYATRIVDDVIEVDLTPDEPALLIEKAKRSLEEAVVENQTGRMARDVVRLLQAGVPAAEMLSFGAFLDSRYAEYGTTHALPVATDLIEYLNGEIEHDALVIMQLMELVAEPIQRRPPQRWPAAIPSKHFTNELIEAVENEDASRAVGLVRGNLDEAGPALLRCAGEHFLGFGHPLIYTTKALELLAHDGTHREDVFAALTMRIVSSTREDTLPPMAKWRKWVDGHEFRAGERSLEGKDELARRILDPKDGEIEEQFLEMIGATKPEHLVDVLVEAAAQRLLNFDPAIHEDWAVQDNWLFVTHPLTYAHAIREALQWSDDPAILKNLVWSLAFIRRSHRLDLPDPVRPRSHPATSVGDVIAALERKDPAVVDIAHACDGDPGPALRSWLLAGQAVRPIYIAHQIKTARVVLQETRTDTPLLGALRFLATPITERPMRGVVHEAAQLVIHGNLPKLRAS